MALLGAHMSTSGGLSTAFDRGAQVGCATMQIFTKNQNRWQQKPTPPEEIERWKQKQGATGIAPVVSHAAYLLNLGTPNSEIWDKSVDALADELTRAQELNLLGVVLHPGAHMGEGEEAGIARIVKGMDLAHRRTPGYKTLTLVEGTAGQGSALGYKFEHLRAFLEGVTEPERLAFCLDTCHLFVAGYDLRTEQAYADTMGQFDELCGIERLKCFHFNDAKKPLGSRVDRHDHIGTGQLGPGRVRSSSSMTPRLALVPKILETEKSDDMHEDVTNLQVLRGLIR
jgi:deoxyribonuclease IV